MLTCWILSELLCLGNLYITNSVQLYGGIVLPPLVRIMSPCQMFILTCQIIMSPCQIFMLTCQIIMLPCQIFMLTNIRCYVDMSDNFVYIWMPVTGQEHIFKIYFFQRMNKWQVNIKVWHIPPYLVEWLWTFYFSVCWGWTWR